MKNLHLIYRSLSVILVASLLFTACKKGDTGPTGPKGETGEKGNSGEKGSTGTANVVYSDWTDIQFNGGTAVFKAPKLNQAMLDRGEISVYWKAIGIGGYIYYKLNYHQDNAKYSIEYFPALGQINLASGTSYANTKLTLRYVLIPGGIKGSSGINMQDYNAVKKAFNLSD